MIYCASDLHIGYENTRYDKINDFFDIIYNDADELILVGDTFDLWRSNWSQILNEHKDIIFRLANISKRIPVTIIRGNHDYNFSDYYLRKLSHNIKILDKHEDNKFIFIHGWQFDIQQRMGSIFYKQIIEYFPILYQLFFRKPSQIFKKNDGESEQTMKIHNEAKQFSIKKNKRIVMGHTHIPLLSENVIDCGDFVDSCSYITIENDIKIHYL